MTDALPTLSKGFRPNETTDMYHDDYDFERLFVGGAIVSRLGLEADCIGDFDTRLRIG